MDSHLSNYHLLEKTVQWLIGKNAFHICIHDTSGVLYETPSLALSPHYKIHSSPFCYCAKSTASGLRFCLKYKSYSILKAIKEKTLYVGSCYLGITEIIQPVFWNEKLICIIYLGNLILNEQKPELLHRIQKISLHTGVKDNLLYKKLDTLHPIHFDELESYKDAVRILHQQILLILAQPSIHKMSKKNASLLPITSGSQHWVIDSIQNYVAAYYNRDIRLSDLAKLYFLNPQYLCRLFRKEMGIHFTEYIHKIRIEHAKQMLTISEDSIVDIALEVGFNHTSYFNRIFKKYTGLTPGEYRQKDSDKKMGS